jgi:hypothetical protein
MYQYNTSFLKYSVILKLYLHVSTSDLQNVTELTNVSMLMGGLMLLLRDSKDNNKPTTMSDASNFPAVSELLS